MEKILRIIQELQDNGKVKMYVVEKIENNEPEVKPIVFDCVKIMYGKAYAEAQELDSLMEKLYEKDGKTYAYVKDPDCIPTKPYNINECFFTEEEAKEKLRKILRDEISRLKRLLIWNNATPTTND